MKEINLAAILKQQRKNLILLNLDFPKIPEGYVLIKMKYSGICHTQLNEINGILVSPGNVNELFLATEKLINNNNLRLRIGQEAKKIAEDAEVQYIENKCIKQEYQKLFQKSNPVFPVLKS